MKTRKIKVDYTVYVGNKNIEIDISEYETLKSIVTGYKEAQPVVKELIKSSSYPMVSDYIYDEYVESIENVLELNDFEFWVEPSEMFVYMLENTKDNKYIFKADSVIYKIQDSFEFEIKDSNVSEDFLSDVLYGELEYQIVLNHPSKIMSFGDSLEDWSWKFND